MKRTFLAALTAGALVISGIGAANTAHAANVQNDVQIPVSGQVVNPCNGEVVDFTGYFHVVTSITTDATGGLHVAFHDNAQGITAVGETTGVKYAGTQADNMTLNLTSGASNQTLSGQFAEIAQGTAPNFIITYVAHITVNADGTVTVVFSNFSATCH